MKPTYEELERFYWGAVKIINEQQQKFVSLIEDIEEIISDNRYAVSVLPHGDNEKDRLRSFYRKANDILDELLSKHK